MTDAHPGKMANPFAALIRDLAAQRGACIGCKDCRGTCVDLIEMGFLPETILGKDHNV